MDFGILGPIEVRDGDRPVALGGAQQRTLLALLLIHVNEPVAIDRLTEALWPRRRRDVAARNLQVVVSRLRRTLAGEGAALRTRPPGYELHLDPGRVDARRFERAVATGRRELAAGEPHRARDTLRAALALWRGPALADLAFHDACRAEILRLEGLRLAATEDLFDAELAAGGHAAVVGDLEAFVREQPLRERARGQLMLALYRAGRQADALDAFTAGRAVLRDELGLEPGRELYDLQRAILAQDRVLDGSAVAPPAASPLVGRDEELACLDAALAGARAGRGSLLLVEGEPGIGKSSLLDAFRERAAAQGAQVLAGRCWEAGGAPVFWPWVDALRPYVAACDPAVLDGDVGTVLGAILGEGPSPGPEAGPAIAADDAAARFRLFDAVAQLLRRAGERAPLVLTLDDLHAGDVSSVLLLRFVARELDDAAIVVVAAHREGAGGPAARELAALAAAPVAIRIPLAGLPAAETGRLVEHVLGRRPGDRVVAALHADTDGNPLFVAELARLLAARDALEEHGAGAPLPAVPAGVREVIRRRLDGLPADERELLIAAALLGRELEVSALAAVAHATPDAILDRLAGAIGRAVLDHDADRRRLRFSHALVCDALVEDLAPGARMRLHHRIGEALEARFGAARDEHLAQLAHHFALASGDDDRALGYARAAGDRAARLAAFEEAARLYELALQCAGPADAARGELLLALGDARARAGEEEQAKQAYLDAAEAGRAWGAGDVVAGAALGLGGRFLWFRAASDRRLVPLLEDALRALGPADGPARVRLLARHAAAVRGEAPAAERARTSAEAVATARRIGDPALLAYALDNACTATWGPRTLRPCLAAADEVIALARSVGDAEREFAGREHALYTAWALGDMTRVRAQMRAMAALAEQLAQPAQRWLVAGWRVLAAVYAGRLAEAGELVDRAAALGHAALPWNATAMQRLQSFLCRDLLGRLDGFADVARRAAAEYVAYPILACVHAATLARLGRRDETRDALATLRDGAGALVFGDDEMRLVACSLVGDAAVATGELELVERVHAELVPSSDLVLVAPPELCLDAVDHTLGRLAAALERWDEADERLDRAVATNTRIGALPWIPLAERARAAALRRRGRSTDRARAAALDERATAGLRWLGMRC